MSEKKPKIPSPKTVTQYNQLVDQAKQYFDEGNLMDALGYYSKALDFKGHSPNILILMAKCLFGLGMKSKAIDLMEHALIQNADNPNICETLGNACITMNLNDLAVKFFTIYVQINPNEPIGYNNLATALRENGQIDESIQILQDIIPIFPENAHLWNSIGAAVSFRDGYVPALTFYEEAYRLNPKIPTVTSNLSLAHAYLGQYDKALEFSRESVKLSPNTAAFHVAVAHRSLAVGNFDEAFDALKWNNHHSEPGSVFMPYDIEQWQGQDLKGKTILIGAEQGIGDEIFFASLYPQLIKEAEHIIIGCDPRLVSLFQNSFQDATIIPYTAGQHSAGYKVRLYDGLEPEKVDYMCLFTDIMRYKWRSQKDIPDMTKGFLSPGADQVVHWQEEIAKLPHKINIGICWRSGLMQAKRDMFYAQLTEWAPVLNSKEVNFINVQYGDCADELKELEDVHGIKIHNFSEINLKDDFVTTAALMQNLDLVIGPATTSLAQAVTTGAPVWWVTYNTKPWWCFGLEDSTPLYPDYTISIKPPSLDWDSYLTLFAEEKFAPWLAQKIAEKSS